MLCFIHQDREAVGACKACAKGLCPECAIDLGHGLACKGVHEEAVNLQHSIFLVTARAVTAAPRNVYITPAFIGAMGVIFAWFGYSRLGGPENLPFLMGCAFLVYSLVVFIRNRAIYSRKR
jgi:hypothetical protein